MINKKNISTLKLYTETNKLKNLITENNFILFFYFQFFNNQEQLILNKLLKKHNLKSIIISKKVFNYVFNNTKYNNLSNIVNNNLLLIYSIDINNNKAIKQLITNKKLELISAKIGEKFYRPSKVISFINLDKSIQIKPLTTIIELLSKVRSSISLLKI